MAFKKGSFNYKKANRILLILIVVINGYVIAAPFWPQLVFWYQGRTTRAQQLQSQVKPDQTARNKPLPPQPDSLTIPSMMFKGDINEGTDTYAELDKGVWLWPGGSRPDLGSNTIMLGHRFTYTNPRGVFYFLDRVQPNDEIGVIWHNKRYVYRVVGSKVVEPTDVSILNPTVQPTLTLYTCTPLWNPHQRLVVTATLEQHP